VYCGRYILRRSWEEPSPALLRRLMRGGDAGACEQEMVRGGLGHPPSTDSQKRVVARFRVGGSDH